MIPTLSTLRISCFSSIVHKITLAQLIVIVTLLPFSFQTKDSQLVIYSNGPCLVVRFFESQLRDSSSSSLTLRPIEVPLKIAGKDCSINDPGWLTSIDYYVDPVNLNFHLIWADSDSQTLWTGRVNSTNYHVTDVKQLRDTNSILIGSRVRSLIVNSGKLFISLPYSHRIEMYDLKGGLTAAQQKPGSPTVDLNRTILLADDNDRIGKVLYNQKVNKLFWIEGSKCLWTGTPDAIGISDKKVLLCENPLSDEIIYSAVIDPDSGDIFVFYENGKIERLSGPNWSKQSTVIRNCLAGEKYQHAKFYTVKMIKEKQFLTFYASDTQHYAFRQISLIKRFEAGANDEGDADEYVLNTHNSGILFTDAPNIYDFIFPDLNSSANKLMAPNEPTTKSHRNQNPSISSQTQHLPESRKSIKKFTPSPADDSITINPLSKLIVSASSSKSPIESLPPQITLLTVTSSSTIIYWLYGLVSIGFLILCLWVLVTLAGLKRNYQKVYSDDNSLKETLTSVKY